MKHLILVTAMVLAMAGSATYADDIVHGDETKLWLYNDLAQRGLYLTPSVKLGFGERSQFFLEAGAGWYNSDFAEVSCLGIYYYYCEELDAPFYSNTVGAYLGFRAGLGKAAFVSVRAHQADFGRVSGIDSAPPIFLAHSMLCSSVWRSEPDYGSWSPAPLSRQPGCVLALQECRDVKR